MCIKGRIFAVPSSLAPKYHTWTYEQHPTKITPQFIVTPRNGFLPRQDPLGKLPSRFEKLENILQAMPITLKDGTPGLLSKGTFGNTVKDELPLYKVDDIDDSALLMALFRDYTFAASAYLLEPCYLMHRSRGCYGLGRDSLPANIAVPMSTISEKIGAKPFMEYAQSYALYNYRRLNKSLPMDLSNLELIRTFSGLPSESGFILVHVDMVAQSKCLVSYVISALDAASRNDRYDFYQALGKLVTIMQGINASMEKMWKHSAPSDYMKFRTFIMGTKTQENIFPNGVVYEGTDDTQPRFYRGLGANDSIIATLDNFLELTRRMPRNEMREILKDFQSYRPTDHSRWLKWVESSAKEVSVEKFAEESTRSLVFYILLLNEVRDFKARHWNFAREYIRSLPVHSKNEPGIIKRTLYPTTTGGSPMVTKLPNQLGVVLDTLQEKCEIYDKRRDIETNGLPTRFHEDIVKQNIALKDDVKKMSEMYGLL